MRFPELSNLLFASWKQSLKTNIPTPTTCALGPPGVGKSAMGKSLAQRMTDHVMREHPTAAPAVVKMIDLTSALPEDFAMPMPKTDKNGKSMLEYAHQDWMVALSEPDAYGVLILDDLPAAMPAVQAATRQLVLDRAIHGRTLSNKVIIIVTGNRRQDKSGATTLPAHFRNSVNIVSVEPNLDDWSEWYGRQDGHAPIVASFLRWKEARLSMTPDEAGPNGAFPTPRSWALLGRQYGIAQDCGLLLQVAEGFVGEGVAVEFIGFVNIRSQLVNPEEVLKDPQRAIPNPRAMFDGRPDHIISMATGVAEVSARVIKETKDDKVRDLAYAKFLRATAWITQDAGEYTATAVHTFVNNGGDVKKMLAAAAEHKEEPIIKSMIGRLASVFKKSA